MPVMDVPDYVGLNRDQLTQKYREKDVKLSIICPRKLPFFIRYSA